MIQDAQDKLAKIHSMAVQAMARGESLSPSLVRYEIESEPIKPKDEKMEEPYIKVIKAKNIYYQDKSLQLEVPLSEAERLGEEAKRIRAEIAKRDEIGLGDYVVWSGVTIFRAESIEQGFIKDKRGDRFSVGLCKKLHPTPEVKAWLDSVIK